MVFMRHELERFISKMNIIEECLVHRVVCGE